VFFDCSRLPIYAFTTAIKTCLPPADRHIAGVSCPHANPLVSLSSHPSLSSSVPSVSLPEYEPLLLVCASRAPLGLYSSSTCDDDIKDRLLWAHRLRCIASMPRITYGGFPGIEHKLILWHSRSCIAKVTIIVLRLNTADSEDAQKLQILEVRFIHLC